MKTLIWATALCCSLFVPAIVTARPLIVTASEVNGTWRSKYGTFRILALGDQQLKVEFVGSYVYKLADGSPMANSGVGNGTAYIEGIHATFKPRGVETGCLISMKFLDGMLDVNQTGTCGFGLNVSATGKYRRVDESKPKFDFDER